jgi:hypothetical protein
MVLLDEIRRVINAYKVGITENNLINIPDDLAKIIANTEFSNNLNTTFKKRAISGKRCLLLK